MPGGAEVIMITARKNPMQTIDLGLIDYRRACEEQERHAARVQSGAPDVLLLMEHPPVVTLGRNKGESSLFASPEDMARLGVDLVRSTRGGDATCHFPGQLVAWPVCLLAGRGVKAFVHALETAVARTAARFGVNAGTRPGLVGVWVEDRKLCSLGLAVKRKVTRHGLALNVAPDLSLFNLIVPCGLPGVRMTSLALEADNPNLTVNHVKDILAQEIAAALAPA